MVCVFVLTDFPGFVSRRHRAAGRLQRGVPPPAQSLPRLEVKEQEEKHGDGAAEGAQVCHRLRYDINTHNCTARMLNLVCCFVVQVTEH